MALVEGAEGIPSIGIDDLEMKGKLGRGAGGDVYMCHWKSKDIHVALKQVTKDTDREVQTMSRIEHPNIIKLYATTSVKDMIDTRFYIVLELAENGSLYEHFQKTPKQPDLEKSLKWAEEIANGMAYLHQQSQAHRDLKSQNVLLTKDWVAKIGDFGSTKELNRTTAATARTGTYGWMAPEVLRHKAYSKKCDVYSFGMLLWELITHDEPYRGLSVTQIQLEVAKENGKRPPIPISCGQKLKKLINDCWQDDPEKRPEFESILTSLAGVKAECINQLARKPIPKPAPFRLHSIKPRETDPTAGMVSIELSDLELGEQLGEGAFATVYKGRWLSKDREVSIREMKTTAEYNIFSSLPHENLIRVFAVAEKQPMKYIVTELAEYGDLCQYMEERCGQPEPDRSLKWAIDVAEGMCFLHEKHIAHRGLKSKNVMLTSDLTAKIDLSFFERRVSCTTMMTLVGIDAWTSPEMMMTKPCNKQVDVYSYGIFLWELITYEKPWDSLTDNEQILSAVTKGERPAIPKSTDSSVKGLIENCWQSKPENRPCFESILYSLEECEMGKMEHGELEFKKRVGKGTFAVVWKGYWNTKKAGKILVAIKNITDMDKTEVNISSSLRHPKIIRFYGCVVSPLHLSLVTEFAENGSLGSYIEKRLGKPEKERAVAWGREIAEGMQYLHEREYGHRDLNSSNVVLVSNWTAKICDLATVRTMKHSAKQSLAGTFAWMPPEMMKEEPTSKMCDVYSYAIVLWELITFKVPFEGLSDMVILMNVTCGDRPEIPKHCDKFFSDLIQQCWADNYKERPSFDDIMKAWQNK